MPKPKERAVIGWREWVALPGFGVNSIKVKVDTGARTSSLHAWDVEEFERDGEAWVRFQIHPEQRRETPQVEVEARLKERRHVRPSTGRRQLRPVVVTEMEIFGHRFPVELTLASRDAMGFRMLLGRQALRQRFIVDPARSYLNGRRIKGTDRITSSTQR
jgi:hypothetical protein